MTNDRGAAVGGASLLEAVKPASSVGEISEAPAGATLTASK